MRKHIDVTFEGFWNERSLEKIPHESGIYIVTDGLLDEDGKSVALERILFVGSSEDAAASISNSETRDLWREECGVSNITDEDDITVLDGEDNELFFSFAPLPSPERERAAAAIVFEHTPKLNDEEEKIAFAYADTKINLHGKTGLLNTDYEVVMDYADAPAEDDNRTDEFIDQK
jgi:hypothetical protein